MSFAKIFDTYKHYLGEQRGNPKQWDKAFLAAFLREQGNDEEFYTLFACTSGKELKKEYRRLAKLYHPDKAGGDTEKTRRLIETYESLKSKVILYKRQVIITCLLCLKFGPAGGFKTKHIHLTLSRSDNLFKTAKEVNVKALLSKSSRYAT